MLSVFHRLQEKSNLHYYDLIYDSKGNYKEYMREVRKVGPTWKQGGPNRQSVRAKLLSTVAEPLSFSFIKRKQ